LGRALLVVRRSDRVEAEELARVLYRELEVVELPDNYRASPSTYLTPKWVSEIRKILDSGSFSKVYVYDVLSPRHVSYLMKELKVSVEDRVMLILDVLAEHAGSKEAKIQIEMAKLRHQLPLIRDWVRRVKLGELPGFLGPGGYAIDTYYTHVRRRIAKLKRELERIRRVKDIERIRREERGFKHVAIAGYTNAGKTTLFNKLTGENRATGPELLTTTTTKAKMVPIGNSKTVFIDTIGFIRDIPPEIVEAFYATLKEISTASAVILMLDSSDSEEAFSMKLRESMRILVRIGYVGKPLIVALNKVDLVQEEYVRKLGELVERELRGGLWSYRIVPISALKGVNIDLLKKVLEEVLEPPTHLHGVSPAPR